MTAFADLAHAARDTVRDDLLRKFANHREACHCFICRTLTDDERAALQELRNERKTA